MRKLNLSSDNEVAFADKAFLIIDDFHGMRAVLRDILRSCGANSRNISTASNGGEAIAALERNRFDVVLCDYNLGAGKNGQQVLEEARHRRLISPSCAWIIVTAEKTTDIITGAAEHQPDTYLIKPVTEAMLSQRLRKVWAKKEAFAEIDAAVGRKDYRKAIELCDERLKTDQANAVELMRIKAQMLVESGKLAQAKELFEQAVAEREFPWARVGLAKVLYQERDYNAAKFLLEGVVTENRTYVEAYDWLARSHEALGELEEMERVLQMATRISPNSVQRQKALGEVALKLGKLDNAENAFKKSVSLGEHSVFRTPDAYLGLAKTYGVKEKGDEALQVLDALTKKFDDDTVQIKALTVEGMVHHQCGNPVGARKVAKELMQQMDRKPQFNDGEAVVEMSEFLMMTGEGEKAASLLQEQVKRDPENAALLERVQQVFDTANLADQGAQMLEQSRKESIARMNEGVLLARDGKLDEAVASLREVRRAMPQSARVLFNLVHVIILLLKARGGHPALIQEARGALLEANRYSPGEARFGQMMEMLESIASAQ
ncbi:MAG TPA: tetratricopeptide repeat protein [Rhodocyclaceae bacterium]|nr:tetratricopeptide repeat protein [Rhodocyclaceae bacterium]